MKVGRVGSAWLGVLLRIVLCLGVALAAGCNRPKEQTEETEETVEKVELAQVCGRVTLTDGGKEEVTATIFNGFEEVYTTVKPDGGYCLPVRQPACQAITMGPESHVYVFLTATGHRPKVLVAQPVHEGRHALPDVALSPFASQDMGGVIGALAYWPRPKHPEVPESVEPTRATPARFMPGAARGGAVPVTAVWPPAATTAIPVGLMQVTLTGPNNIFNAVSDKNGTFYVEVPPGTYRLSYDREKLDYGWEIIFKDEKHDGLTVDELLESTGDQKSPIITVRESETNVFADWGRYLTWYCGKTTGKPHKPERT